MRSTIFTVRGAGHFPYDMLRYDQCFPYGQTDSLQLEHRSTHPRAVRLLTYHRDPTPHLTPDRWLSFGWCIDTEDNHI